MSGGFRRSSTFGIVGVVVVMVACALIALQFGSGTDYPRGALIAIVAIVFGFLAILMVLQHRDLDRVQGRARGEALESTDTAWGIARSSMNSGAIMCVLIFCAMAPWLIFQWVWSLVIVVPVIGLYLLYLVARILIPSGTGEDARERAAGATHATARSSRRRRRALLLTCGRLKPPLRTPVRDQADLRTRRLGAGNSTAPIAGEPRGLEPPGGVAVPLHIAVPAYHDPVVSIDRDGPRIGHLGSQLAVPAE